MTKDDILRAAEVLEHAAKSYGAAYPQHWQWTADQLRREASYLGAE